MNKRVALNILGIIMLIILLMDSIYTLKSHKIAVVTQFDRIVGINDKKGIYFKLPFIQDENYLDKYLHLLELENRVETKDKKSIMIFNQIFWKIKNPGQYFRKNQNGIDIERIVYDNFIKNEKKVVKNCVIREIKVMPSSRKEEASYSFYPEVLEIIVKKTNKSVRSVGVTIEMAEAEIVMLPNESNNKRKCTQ